jgi:uncharacterized protein (DUF983 family)
MPTQQSPPEPAPEARTVWRPALTAEAVEQPSLWTSIRRGASNHCPVCGQGRVFSGFLRVVDACEVCHAPLGELRADDAPPYIVIFLTGHLLFPPVFWVEKTYEPPMWLHMVVWLPLFAVICTLLLRPVKGAVVGWMMRLGFLDHLSPRDGVPQEQAPVSNPPRDV